MRKRSLGPAYRRRVTLSTRQRLIGLSSLLLPTVCVLLADIFRRAHRIAAFDFRHAWFYVASIADFSVFWAALLYMASRRRGVLPLAAGALFVALYTLSNAVESAF